MTTIPAELDTDALQAALNAGQKVFGGDLRLYDSWETHLAAIIAAAIRAYLAARSAPEAVVTLRQLQAAHIERQAEWCPDQVPDLSFRGNEMAGEVGEACNVIKKLERERQGWRGSRATKEQLAEELGDVIHTAILCAITAGIDIEPATVAKFNSTSEKNGLSTFIPALTSVAPSGAEPVAWRRERDGHLIDQPRLGYAPLYASPQAVPAEDIASFAETLNFYISDAEDGICRVPRQKMVEIQGELRAVAAALTSLSAERDELHRAILGAEPQPGMRPGQFIEMVKTTEAARAGALERAKAAERKLEEHRRALEPFHHIDRALSYSHLQGHIGDEETIPVPAKAIRAASDVFKAGASE